MKEQYTYKFTDKGLEEYVKSIREAAVLAEREACAKVCDEIAEEADSMTKSKFVTDAGRMLHEGMWGGSYNCAAAIRARGE